MSSNPRGRVNGRGFGRNARRTRWQIDGRGWGQQSKHEREGSRIGGGGHQSPENKSLPRPQPMDIVVMTTEDVVSFGLRLVGFGKERQNVGRKLLHDRFLAFYGPDPRSVKDLLFDLKEEFNDTSFADVMMTLNWAKRYDVEHVLAGRWGYGEKYIGAKIKEIAKRIQSFFEKMIVFDPDLFDDREIHIISVDTFNCTTEEMRQTPSTAFFDHKSNSCGLKYEAALPIRHALPVWLKGPHMAGDKHDKTVFCGGTQETAKADRDQSALYFKIPPKKKGVGDSAYEGMADIMLVRREGHSKETTNFINAALARQENYHWRLKSYEILRARFRHGRSTEDKMNLHKMATEMVAVIVQYDLHYRPLSEVDNYL